MEGWGTQSKIQKDEALVAKIKRSRATFYFMKPIFFAIFLGILFGILGAKILLFLFPDITPITRNYMPVEMMVMIFLANSFLATLICFGGLLFSLAEIKVYKKSKIYRRIDKLFDPFYSFLGKISKVYKKLNPMYRSCYLSISLFSVVSLFLYFFLISFYFSAFFFILGASSFTILSKLLPHISLEAIVFTSSALLSFDLRKRVEKFLILKKIKEFEEEVKRTLKDKSIWRKLLLLYLILFIAAFLERTFVQMI